MTLLSRYLLRRFTGNFITVATAFVAIYLLVDFFEKIDKFNDHGASWNLIFKFFFLNIPFILDQLGPVLILLAGVITLGILNHNNELRALKAGGIPLKKIIMPIIAGTLVLTALYFCMAQFLLPATVTTTNTIWYEQLHDKVPLGIHRGGRYYYKGSEGFYSFQWRDTGKFAFQDFSYSQWDDDDFNLQFLLNASSATWKDGVWVFKNAQTQRARDDGSYAYQIFERQKVPLPESPDDFFVPEYRAAELSLTELYHEAGSRETKEQRNIAWANFSSRLSYIFLGLPLLLLGLPVLMVTYRSWGRDLAVAIPASCMLAFVAWGLWGAMQSLAKAGYLSPFISATSIHLIFAMLGIALLQREDR
ncbi:MAG: LptF/LptG family permease [Desulfopila sp.]